MEFSFFSLVYVGFIRSRDGSVGIATGYGLGEPGFDFRLSTIFLFSTASRPIPSPTKPLF
jgi:hypothetical protein